MNWVWITLIVFFLLLSTANRKAEESIQQQADLEQEQLQQDEELRFQEQEYSYYE